MSYNISNQKIKKIEDLKIQIKALYAPIKREDWLPDQPTILDVATNKVEIQFGCEQTIEGFLNDGILTITDIDLNGEGSGAARWYWFDNAMKNSTGYFEAVLIWENGDSVSRLIIDNGKLTDENIDL